AEPASEAPEAAQTGAATETLTDEELLSRLKERRPFVHKRLSSLRERDPDAYRRAVDALRRLHDAGDSDGAGRLRRGGPGEGPHRRDGGPGRNGNPLHAGMQPDPEVRERIQENREASEALHEEVRTLIARYHKAEDDATRTALRDELRAIVEEAFDLTTERRRIAIEEGRRRLEEVQARLQEAEEMLQRRIEHRGEHIDAFLAERLAPADHGPPPPEPDPDGQ
ncbi:MAG: hypothetical protein ACOCX4_04860, partial [Planctomycetota bacterium]